MFSRDGRYEVDAERRIAAGKRVNGASARLMRRQNVSTAAHLTVHNPVLVQTAEKRGYYRRNERLMLCRYGLFVGYDV